MGIYACSIQAKTTNVRALHNFETRIYYDLAMTQPLAYFDNAATSYPKPKEVYEACDYSLRNLGNPGRGSHDLALASARTLFDARETIASFLGISSSERLIFTPGCTSSLNMVLKGLPFKKGDLVIASPLEHNAVMRPLHQIELEKRIQIRTLDYVQGGTIIDLVQLKQVLESSPTPALCALAHGSNVTGEVLNLQAVSDLCAENRVPLLVDAAQTAGHVPVNLAELNVSFWCTSGHKGLMGPPGVGLLYVAPGCDLEPLVSGGTGSSSEKVEMPTVYPDRLESGTMPIHTIAGLARAVEWIEHVGPVRIWSHQMKLAAKFALWCSKQRDIELFGAWVNDGNAIDPEEFNVVKDDGTTGDICADARMILPIVAFRLKNLDADKVLNTLDRDHQVAIRGGLHCAAVAHSSLRTTETGLLRASFGYFNTQDELQRLCDGLFTSRAGWMDGLID